MKFRTNAKILYPTHLNKFSQCPERYRREYQEKRKGASEFSRSLAKGVAIHDIMARAANELRACGGVPANLYELAEAKVPRTSYADGISWSEDVESVVRAAKTGISYLDGESRVLAVEATFHFPYQSSEDGASFTLAAKSDLVLLKTLVDGSEFIEIVDYKSSSMIREDLFQDVAARVTVKSNANTRLGVADLPITNTTLYLGAEASISRELTVYQCRETWELMRQAAQAILLGDEFPPHPSPLCEWCPFYENGCSAFSGKPDDLQLALWLDGSAA